MRSFLEGLIERAESKAPALERRPRGLFEPANLKEQSVPTIIETALQPPELEGETELPKTAMPRPTYATSPLAPPAPKPSMRAEPQPALRSTRAADLQPSAISVPPEIETQAPASPGRPSEIRTAAYSLARTDSRTAMLRPDPVKTIVREVAARAPFAAAPNKATAKEDEPTVARARAPQQSLPQESPALARAPVQPAAVAPPRTPALQPRISHQPASAALLARAERAAVPASPPAAPPAIHISIGRVDVRAHQGAAESPRAAKPSEPRLKLDEYLRQRSRGGR